MVFGVVEVGRIAVLIKEGEPYRRDVWIEGVKNAGYRVIDKPHMHPESQDVLLLWNRIHTQEDIARRYEAAGARVLIAENGYVGENQRALSLGLPNGRGSWHVGDHDRFQKLGIEVRPWRKSYSTDKILVLGQNGIGPEGIASPRKWADSIAKTLANQSHRPVEVRKNRTSRRSPLDFEGVHCVVTWSSSAGIKAMIEGIPAFYGLPGWIGQWSGKWLPYILSVGMDIEKPKKYGRTWMLYRLSWAQWSLDEIKEGTPFCWLLSFNQSNTALK
jgi:hypothetical protein